MCNVALQDCACASSAWHNSISTNFVSWEIRLLIQMLDRCEFSFFSCVFRVGFTTRIANQRAKQFWGRNRWVPWAAALLHTDFVYERSFPARALQLRIGRPLDIPFCKTEFDQTNLRLPTKFLPFSCVLCPLCWWSFVVLRLATLLHYSPGFGLKYSLVTCLTFSVVVL